MHRKPSSKNKKHGKPHKNKSTLKKLENKSNNEGQVLAFKINQSDNMGRYLVASKLIKAQDVILQEEPLVVGPCQESQPLCIGCYANINLEIPDTYERCIECGWPLCKKDCPGYFKPQGHSKEECNYFSKSPIKKKAISCFKNYYYALAPLRCLLLKEKNPEGWKTVQTMETHTRERKNDELWIKNQKMAVNLIRNVWDFKEFIENEIHFVCGALEVNAFEVTTAIPGGQYLRAIYPTAFLFAHNCVPNTCHSNNEKFKLIVRATTSIPPNNAITVSYTYILQPTLKRRKHLEKTKYFLCNCTRCSDPTELGTYLSALKCTKCRNGLIISKDPLDYDSMWKCNSTECKGEMDISTIIPILDKLYKELDSINGNDIINYEKFLKKCEIMLHEDHYICISALHCLSQLYGKIDGYLINDLTDEQLERKTEICKKLLWVFEKLEPGFSKQRGILLYEVHAPLMVLLRRRIENKNIKIKEVQFKMKEILKYLEESVYILSKEPETSTEGFMAQAAQQAILSLKQQKYY